MAVIRKKPPPEGDSVIERQICIGLIISTEFIRSVRPILQRGESLCAPFSRSVAGWCLEYYDRYAKAPGKDIEDLFRSNAPLMSEDDAKAVEYFLASISQEYSGDPAPFNAGYIADKCESYCRLSALSALKENLTRMLAGGRLDDAEQLVGGYMRPSRPTTRGCDPFRDKAAIWAAFDDADRSDLTLMLPGEIGKIVTRFERGHLVGVVGGTNTGKTWWLWFMGYLACLQGFNVVFYSFEMSEKQMIRRIWQTVMARPKRRYPDPLTIPIFDCAHNQSGDCRKPEREDRISLAEINSGRTGRRIYRACDVCKGARDYAPAVWQKAEDKEPLTGMDVMRKLAREAEGQTARMGKFRLVEYPSGALTPKGLRADLNNLEYYEDFIPDVIVTDYADKMGTDGRYDGHRHGLEEIWQAHKGIAQERKCTVITASQSNTVRTGRKVSQGNWDEAIAKLYMVDEGIALNQTPEQKQKGVMIWSVVKQRHDDYDLLESATVLQQLKIGRPYLDSVRGEMKG